MKSLPSPHSQIIGKEKKKGCKVSINNDDPALNDYLLKKNIK